MGDAVNLAARLMQNGRPASSSRRALRSIDRSPGSTTTCSNRSSSRARRSRSTPRSSRAPLERRAAVRTPADRSRRRDRALVDAAASGGSRRGPRRRTDRRARRRQDAADRGAAAPRGEPGAVRRLSADSTRGPRRTSRSGPCCAGSRASLRDDYRGRGRRSPIRRPGGSGPVRLAAADRDPVRRRRSADGRGQSDRSAVPAGDVDTRRSPISAPRPCAHRP